MLQNVDILKDAETVRQLGSILKTNVRACKAVGHPFVVQLGRIYLDMLNVYKCLSENISSAVQSNGQSTFDFLCLSFTTRRNLPGFTGVLWLFLQVRW